MLAAAKHGGGGGGGTTAHGKKRQCVFHLMAAVKQQAKRAVCSERERGGGGHTQTDRQRITKMMAPLEKGVQCQVISIIKLNCFVLFSLKLHSTLFLPEYKLPIREMVL